MAKPDGRWQQPTGISPRPMLMGAPRNALRAFNAGVSLAERRSWPSVMPHTDANWLNRSPKSSFPCGSWRAICWALLRLGSLSGCLWNFQGTRPYTLGQTAVNQPRKALIRNKDLSSQIHTIFVEKTLLPPLSQEMKVYFIALGANSARIVSKIRTLSASSIGRICLSNSACSKDNICRFRWNQFATRTPP